MTVAQGSPSLRSTAKLYWRYFVPMWLLPILVFSTIFLPAWSTHPELVFWLLMLPAGAVSMYWATTPIRKKMVGFSHTAFWAVFVPFLVWALIIFSIFGLSFALGAA